jgi:hypothetical protein
MLLALAHSGVTAEIRAPGGREDLMLREAPVADRRLAVEFMNRVVSGPADVLSLTVYEFEVLLLSLHQLVFGDRIMAQSTCECGAEVDIEFSAGDYLAHHRPRKPGSVVPGKREGWFGLRGTDIQFRLPTIADQIEAFRTAGPAAALAERCVDPPAGAGRASRAMTAVAPPISGTLEGRCPDCCRTVQLMFDVASFVLRELTIQASLVYEEVHLLASRYHWSEERILDLPQERRREYAEMVRAGR